MDAALTELVRQRAGNRCEYSRLPQAHSALRFHIEHIVPRQHGGGDTPENLALACPECNRRKGTNLTGIDPESRRVLRLFHPRQDRWSDHFQTLAPRILPRTDIGRTTEWLLALNSDARLRWRTLLHRLREWP